MVDLAAITIPVNTTEVVEAIAKTNTLSKTVQALFKAVDQGRITQDQYNSALTSLKRSYESLGVSSQKATAVIREYAKTVQDANAANLAARRAQDDLTAAKKRAETAYALAMQKEKESAAQKKLEEDATRKLSQEMTRLETKFNSVKTASMLYAKEVADLNAAQANGIHITGGYEAALEKLNLEYQQFQNGITGAGNRFEVQTQLNTKGMNQMGLATQQLGYQMGDFLVQVQSGTNWMVAFGQQATQAVAVLPMFSTQIGLSSAALLGWATGLGIAIPLVTAVGAAWMRTHEDTSKAKKSLSEMEEQIKSIDGTLTKWIQTKNAAKAGITVEEMFGIQSIKSAEEALKKATEAYDQAVSKAALIGQGMAGGIDLSTLFGTDPESKLKAATDALEAAQKRLNDLKAKQIEDYDKELQSQKDLLALAQLSVKYGEDSYLVKQKQAEIDRRNYEESQKAGGILGKQLEDLMKIYDEQVRLNRVLEEGKGWVENTKDILSDVLRMDASSSFLSKAKQAMADLKTAAEAAALATQKALMAEQAPSTMSGPAGNIADIPQAYGLGYLGGIPPEYAGSPSGLAPGQSVRPKAAPAGLGGVDWGYKPSKGGGGGSKGPSEDTIESRLQKLYEYLGEVEKYQTAAEDIAYQKREDTLKAALDKKLITIQEYNDLEKSIKEKHEAELEKISYAHKSQQLRDSADFFGALASVAEQGGGKMVKAASVFSAAQSLINSYTAYTEMLKDPAFVGRPWARFAAAASVLASGLKMVNAIKGVGSGSSASSAASSATSTMPSAATQAAPQTVYLSGLDPNAFYSGEQLQNLFDAFYDENDKRGKVFVVART